MRAAYVALGWAWAAAIAWLSLTPSPPSIDLSHGDKLGHVAAYALLMFWFAQLYAARVYYYAAGFAVLGVALEFAQGMTGWRTYEPLDMAANALGVLAGWGLSALTPRFLPRQ